jgi:exodeoxyribonuclease VIII
MTILSDRAELVDMDEVPYHAAPALGSTDIKNLLRSPAHYKASKSAPMESEALRIGTLVHECILEPDTWAQRRDIPDVNKRTKAGKAEMAKFYEVAGEEGWLPVDAEDRALCEGMRESVMQHRLVRAVLENADKKEQSCFWSDEHWGVNCKARFDGLAEGLVLDLKTTQDASPGAFRNAVARYDYHVQAFHYSTGAHAVTGEWPDYAILAIEKKPPYACAVYQLDDTALAVGEERRDEALARYAKCQKERLWPGYPETVQTLSLPNWAKQEW